MCRSNAAFPPPPAMSQEEKDLIQKQTSLLQQQQDMLSAQAKENAAAGDFSKAMSGFYDRVLKKKGAPAGKENIVDKSRLNSYREAINKYKNAPERIAGAPVEKIPQWVKDKLSQDGYDISRSMSEHNQTRGGRSNPVDPAKIFDSFTDPIIKDKTQWEKYGISTTQDVAETPDEYEQVINQGKVDAYREKLNEREKLAYDYNKKMYDLLNAPPSEAQQAYDRISLLTAQRQEKALKGELPLSEATQQQKRLEFNQLKEVAARSGGAIEGDSPASAIARGTSANEALGEFNRRWRLVEDSERRGEITSGGQAILSQYGLTSNVTNQRFGQGLSLTQSPPQSSGPGYALSALQYGPGATAAGYGSLASSYGAMQQPYANYNQLRYGGLLQNYQNQQQNQQGMYQLYGQGAGALIGSAAMLASSKTFKKDILEMEPEEEEKSLRTVSKGKVYKWNYKGEKDGPHRHMSLMAEDAPKGVRTPDGKHLDVGNYLGMLHSAVKALDRKVMSLSLKAA